MLQVGELRRRAWLLSCVLYLTCGYLVFQLQLSGEDKTSKIADFDYQIHALQERIEAREQARRVIEEREMTRVRKEAGRQSERRSDTVNAKLSFLKGRFDKSRRERAKEFQKLVGELEDIERDVGVTKGLSDYDRWSDRQEKKATELRERLQQERRLREKYRVSAREELKKQKKVRQQAFRKRFDRERHEKVEREREEGRYFYLYLSPAWPSYAMLFDQQGFGMCKIGYRGFPRALLGDGSRDDLSKLEYTDQSVLLRDLVCECGLLKSGTVASKGGAWDDDPAHPETIRNPFYILADAPVTIESKRYEMPITLGGSMGIGDGNSVLSIYFPLVYHSRELKIDVATPRGADDYGNAALIRYVNDPDTLLKEVFDARYLDVGGRDSGIVTCCASASFYRRFDAKKGYKGILGLTASVPVVSQEGEESFQQPRLGDDYFFSAALFAGALVPKSKYINPHIFGQIRLFMNKDFRRRLPHRKNYSGSGALPLLMSNFVQQSGSSAFSNIIDSQVALFAEELALVKVERPMELELIVGNQLKEEFGIAGFLDLFYMLRIRCEDSITTVESDDNRQWEVGKLLFGSQEIEHRIGFDWRYQWSSKFTFGVGGLYTMAGQSVPENYEINATIRAEF